MTVNLIPRLSGLQPGNVSVMKYQLILHVHEGVKTHLKAIQILVSNR